MARAITHSIMGQRNRAGALQLIRRTGGISRVALAERLGLSRAAVTNIANELVESGIVRDEASASLARDLPRSFLRLNPAWALVVTVNLTHNLAIGVVDLAGDLVSSQRLAGDDEAHDAYRGNLEPLLLPALCALLDSLEGRRVLGIGVLSYGAVDREGIIRANTSLGRANVDMREVLAPVTDLPVLVDHEFRLLLMAEMWRGDAARLRNAVAMSGKLSGYGGARAVVVDGHLCYGAQGFAGQHGWAEPTPHRGPEMENMEAEIARTGGPAAYFRRLRAGDGRALDLYRKAVENYGSRAAHVINDLNPDRLLLYTAYAALGQRFLDDVRAEAGRRAAPVNMEGLEIAFGGARTDEEHLAAAAMPLLMEFFEKGDLEAPELKREAAVSSAR